jgi:hypothetical protein
MNMRKIQQICKKKETNPKKPNKNDNIQRHKVLPLEDI